MLWTLRNHVKPQSPRHLIDDVGVMRRSLVVHAPAAVDEFQPTFLHQLMNECLSLLSLLPPPQRKEAHLHVNEPARHYNRYSDPWLVNEGIVISPTNNRKKNEVQGERLI